MMATKLATAALLSSVPVAWALTSAIAPGAPALGTTANYNGAYSLTDLWNATNSGARMLVVKRYHSCLLHFLRILSA